MFFKVTRSMETPLEKEIVRGEPPSEGSGLFEHSAANSSELTPGLHGTKFCQLSSFEFFVFFEMMQPNTDKEYKVTVVLFYKTLNLVESGLKARGLFTSGDQGLGTELALEEPAPRGR